MEIRGLYKLAIPDAYPRPQQAEVMARMSGAARMSVVDWTACYYQWLLAEGEHVKMSVITHRGQESFLVPIMGYHRRGGCQGF